MPAVVELSDLFVNDAEDPSDYVVFSYAGDSYQVTSVLGGGVEGGYASGRSRTWSTEDDTVTVNVTLLWVTAEQAAWLIAHRGQTVCFRDPDGRKVFAAFHQVPVGVSTIPAHARVDSAPLSLTSVTFSEAV